MILLIMFILLFLFLAMGVPVAFALGTTSVVYMVLSDIPRVVIAQQLIEGASGWVLLSMPLFIIAGGLMNTSTISQRIIDFSTSVVGHIRGGLAMVVIMANMIFGGISGSSVADTAAIGSVMIPGMIDKGYPADYSAAVTAASATIGIIIPPSIPMIFYGAIAGVSVGTLFIAGIIPGILVGLAQMLIAYIIAVVKKHPTEAKFSFINLLDNLRKAAVALVMPIIIIGGIIFGIFTPTEAGAIAVAYSIIVGTFAFRAITWKNLYKVFVDATIMTAVVMIIISTSQIFAWIMSYEGIPQMITSIITGWELGQNVLLLVLLLMIIILGTFLHGDPIMFLVVPILLPLIQQLNINLILFGIIVVFGIGVGQQTPPVASCLYVASSISGVDIISIAKVSWPFVLAIIAIAILIIFFPDITLFLPRVVVGF